MDILPQLLFNALIAGSLYAFIAVGMALTFGLLRILNFAHAHLMMVCAYIFYGCFSGASLGLGLSSLLTLLFAMAFSFFTLRLVIAPFAKYGLLLTLVATLAWANVCEATISMLFGVNVKALSLEGASESIEFAGVYATPVQLLIISSAFVILGAIAFLLHSTSFGRKVRAISEDVHAAEALGINRWRISAIVFGISTVLAAYAGVLIGFDTNLQPTMASSYTIKAFAAMIVGGMSNIWGTIAGSFLLGLLENLALGIDIGGWSIPAGYKDAFSFLIILVLLLVKPEGLFSGKRRKI